MTTETQTMLAGWLFGDDPRTVTEMGEALAAAQPEFAPWAFQVDDLVTVRATGALGRVVGRYETVRREGGASDRILERWDTYKVRIAGSGLTFTYEEDALEPYSR